jgi:hypothetical protein
LDGTETFGVGGDSGHGRHISSNALCVSGVGLAPAHSRCGSTRDDDERSCGMAAWWLDTLPGLGDIPGRGEGRFRPGDPTPMGE